MPLKETIIRLMQKMGTVRMIPFSVIRALTKIDRRFRFLFPPDQEFIYTQYLGDLSVHINTLYPVEVEMATGIYDIKTSTIIKRFIRPTDTVVDIGANVGALTLLMAKLAHSGKVIAVEPGALTYGRLLNNLKLNPQLADTVATYQIGLSEQAGELFWQEDINNRGNAGLFDAGEHRVIVEPLDSFLERTGVESLDFVKIDVEGMEYEVISGGRGAIENFRPIIYYETLEACRKMKGFDSFERIYQILDSLGYQNFSVLSHGKIKKIPDLSVLESPNTLAIPREKIDF